MTIHIVDWDHDLRKTCETLFQSFEFGDIVSHKTWSTCVPCPSDIVIHRFQATGEALTNAQTIYLTFGEKSATAPQGGEAMANSELPNGSGPDFDMSELETLVLSCLAIYRLTHQQQALAS